MPPPPARKCHGQSPNSAASISALEGNESTNYRQRTYSTVIPRLALFRASHELLSATLSNLAVGLFLTGKRRPSLFFHVLLPVPRILRLDLFELLLLLGILVEPGDTARCEALGDGVIGDLFSHHVGCTTSDPATPIESDDSSENRATDGAPKS